MAKDKAKDKKERKDPMEAVIANIEKQMGKKAGQASFTRFGDSKRAVGATIPFGITDVDEASHCGGVPYGKLVEIFGHESSGKSLLSLYLIASAQKMGKECVLVDIEQSFDPSWASMHGVDASKLIYNNDFDSGEQALEYAYQFAKSGAVAVIVVDSTAALVPLSELNGSLEDNPVVGEQARMMSRGIRKLNDACGKTGTICIFINQIRSKIGVMFGSPETTPGGKALSFYSSIRIRTYQKGKIKVPSGKKDKDGKDIGKVVGIICVAQFIKNKAAMPFGQAEFKIIFDAKSMNPVVMLCEKARSLKLIRVFKGLLNLAKEVTGEKVDTDATNLVEMADYLIKKDLVIPLLDKTVEAIENSSNEEKPEEPLDEVVLEMKTDPSKIVSPTDGSEVATDSKKLADTSVEEVGEDAKEAEVPEE